MSASKSGQGGIWGQNSSRAALRQIADVLLMKNKGVLEYAKDRLSFELSNDEEGTSCKVKKIVGRVLHDQSIRLFFNVLRLPKQSQVSAYLIKAMEEVAQKFPRVDSPNGPDPDVIELWIEMKGEARPMGMTREAAFLNKIDEINTWTKAAEDYIPSFHSHPDLEKLFESQKESLELIRPAMLPPRMISTDMETWVTENVNFIQARLPLAVESPNALEVDFALALTARVLSDRGEGMGRFNKAQISCDKIIELIGNAPGHVAIPGTTVSMGSDIYRRNSEMAPMLAALERFKHCVVFTGSMAELQDAFHGGQGGTASPLRPVVRHVPPIPVRSLIEFSLFSEVSSSQNLTKAAKKEMADRVEKALSAFDEQTQKGLISPTVRRELAQVINGGNTPLVSTRSFVRNLDHTVETLNGLAVKPRAFRSQRVQSRWMELLKGSKFSTFAKVRLYGQDKALTDLNTCLFDQVMTRPMHQCLRCITQGSPGTGKRR